MEGRPSHQGVEHGRKKQMKYDHSTFFPLLSTETMHIISI